MPTRDTNNKVKSKVLKDSSKSGPRILDGGSNVLARPEEAADVVGKAEDNNRVGVYGFSKGGVGVFGRSENSIGIYGEGLSLAGQFKGDIEVTGNIRVTGDIEIIGGADFAEDFDIADDESVEPGTLMILGANGVLQQSHEAYDKRVAGVISGAGNYKPGIVLDKQRSQSNRKPIALFGKVYCKVDADYAPIEVGDLLTSSLTPGHAMKANDQLKAFGSVVGKALLPLKEGHGLLPILIALQ